MFIWTRLGDKVIYSKGFGTRKTGSDAPVNVNTLFQIGSTSKAFTAVLVAMLVDEGKVSWDDRVVDHLPDFRMYDPWVTREFRVRDLMAQRSGMPGYSGDYQSSIGFDRNQIMHNIRHIKPVSSFRSEFAYQNSLFLVAARLVEVKTGKTWEENLKEKIFNPLGMNETSADMKSYTDSSNSSFIHVKKGGAVAALPMNWRMFKWPYVYGPAGGINSNVLDMAKWIRFNFNCGKLGEKQLVSEKNMAFLHSPKTITDLKERGAMQYYCQGWVYRECSPRPIVWHTGGTTGCSTMVAFVPDADLGIIILTNYRNELHSSLANYFIDRYFDKPMYDWSGAALARKKEAAEKNKAESAEIIRKIPAMPLEDYVGKYSNSVLGVASIEKKGEELVLTVGPDRINFVLRRHTGDVFKFITTDYDEEPGYAVFLRDNGGKIVTLKMDIAGDMDDDGFERLAEKASK